MVPAGRDHFLLRQVEHEEVEKVLNSGVLPLKENIDDVAASGGHAGRQQEDPPHGDAWQYFMNIITSHHVLDAIVHISHFGIIIENINLG